MASPNFYNPGGTTGARLATRSPIAMSGRIWYVCNLAAANGADAASPAGQQRTRPLLTTAQAITNASAGDTIQYLEGHAETIAVTVALSKAGLKFWSEGTEATRATFTLSAATTLLNITAAGVWLENFTFISPSAAGGTAQLAVTAVAGVQVQNCIFQCGNTLTAGLSIATGASGLRVTGCTFTSVSTTIATRPVSGMLLAAGTGTDYVFDACTFDGGTVGWSDYALKCSQAVTRLTTIDLDLLNDSDSIVATGSIYTAHRRNASGSSWMEFVA